MALDIAELARRAVEIAGGEAVASVSLRRELVVLAGPHGALVPPRRTFDVFLRLLLRDGAGRCGVARCSTSTSDAHLEALVTSARANASAAPFDLTALPRAAAGPIHDGFDASTAELDPIRAAATAREAAASIAYVLGTGRTALWRGEHVELAVATGDGALAQDRRTGAQLLTRCTDADGRLMGVAQGSATAGAAIDPVAVGLAATPADAPARRDGRGPVIATPDDTVVLLPAALAPLLEVIARAACTGHAHATGASPFTGRLGTPVAPPSVTLWDDPTRPDTFSRAIDVEGLPTRATLLVEAGVERAVVHDTRSAEEIGARSTGHAAELGGAVDGPLPRNLVLEPGGASSAAALGLEGRTVVIPMIDHVLPAGPGATQISAIGRAAYVVEDGSAIRLLGDVLLAGDLVDLLAAIGALTTATELVATIDRLPERTRATRCPAAATRGLTVVAA